MQLRMPSILDLIDVTGSTRELFGAETVVQACYPQETSVLYSPAQPAAQRGNLLNPERGAQVGRGVAVCIALCVFRHSLTADSQLCSGPCRRPGMRTALEK